MLIPLQTNVSADPARILIFPDQCLSTREHNCKRRFYALKPSLDCVCLRRSGLPICILILHQQIGLGSSLPGLSPAHEPRSGKSNASCHLPPRWRWGGWGGFPSSVRRTSDAHLLLGETLRLYWAMSDPLRHREGGQSNRSINQLINQSINPPLVSAETGAPFRDRQSETQTSECGSWHSTPIRRGHMSSTRLRRFSLLGYTA